MKRNETVRSERRDPSTLRIAGRGLLLTLLLWSTLSALHTAWHPGSGAIGAMMEEIPTLARILVYLSTGAMVGLIDRILQEHRNGNLAIGMLAGAAGWLIGGVVLYAYAIPGLFPPGPIPLSWQTSLGEGAMAGYVFSYLSIAAGFIVGLLQGLIQTASGSGQSWRRKGWPLLSAIAGGVAWSCVPMGTLTGG